MRCANVICIKNHSVRAYKYQIIILFLLFNNLLVFCESYVGIPTSYANVFRMVDHLVNKLKTFFYLWGIPIFI